MLIAGARKINPPNKSITPKIGIKIIAAILYVSLPEKGVSIIAMPEAVSAIPIKKFFTNSFIS